MRRIILLFLSCFLIVSLAVNVLAATSASSMTYSAAVAADGSCQVTVDMVVHMESAVNELSFPLPLKAKNVTLNGSSAKTQRSGDLLLLPLSQVLGGALGDFSLRIQYHLSDVVAYSNSKLMMELPILSGFSYPIDAFSFTIRLPDSLEKPDPTFISGYYQQNTDANLEYTASGSMITGSSRIQLKDLETLSLSLPVTEALFPQSPTALWTVGVEEVAMAVLAGLAVIYWLVFLRCAPLRRIRATTAPEGFHPGSLGSALIGQGLDLTMMVLGWAQQGYILLHLEDSGRVTLHKRMSMGNERSPLEGRIFRSLFGKRNMVDGTGYHYALLCRKVAAMNPEIRELYLRSTGNPRVFRFLAAGIGVLGGLSLGGALAGEALLAFVVKFFFAALGGIAAWFIQDWVKGLHLRHRTGMWIRFVCCGVWLLLGVAAAEFHVAAFIVAGELLAGLAAAYGGRRTHLGRTTASEILGLRRYLRTVSPKELQRITVAHPEYFFSLAPYALALGADSTFAKLFGSKRIPACPYLTTGMDGHLSAWEWRELLQRAVTSLDARQQKLPLERLFGK